MTENEAATMLAQRVGLTATGTVKFLPELIETASGQLLAITVAVPTDLSDMMRQMLIMDTDGQVQSAIMIADFQPLRHDDGRWAFYPESHLYEPPVDPENPGFNQSTALLTDEN